MAFSHNLSLVEVCTVQVCACLCIQYAVSTFYRYVCMQGWVKTTVLGTDSQ